MEFKIHKTKVLIQHSERILAALDNIISELNKSPQILPDLQLMSKHLLSNIPITNNVLKEEKILDYAKTLRKYYYPIVHFTLFCDSCLDSIKTLSAGMLRFDITWNNVYVVNFLKLFVSYMKAVNAFGSCELVAKIILSYEFCYFSISKRTDIESIYEKFSYHVNPNYVSEACYCAVPHLRELFSLISQKMVDCFISQSNPVYLGEYTDFDTEIIPEVPFFRLEYIIMMNLSLLADAFIYFSFLDADFCCVNFSELIKCLYVLNSTVDLPSLTPISVISLFEKYNSESKVVKSIIGNRTDHNIQLLCRKTSKLCFILEDMNDRLEYTEEYLPNNLHVVLSFLSCAHFNLSTVYRLERFSNMDDDEPVGFLSSHVIHLTYALFQIINKLSKKKSYLKDYYFYNFGQYDFQYLDASINSTCVYEPIFKKLEFICATLFALDYNKYLNGEQYNLSGLESYLLSFSHSLNHYKKGLNHMGTLFNFVSYLYFKVTIVNNIDTYYLCYVPLHSYWRYLPRINTLVKKKKIENEFLKPVFLNHFKYFSLDVHSFAEIHNFNTECFRMFATMLSFIRDEIVIKICRQLVEKDDRLNNFYSLIEQAHIKNVYRLIRDGSFRKSINKNKTYRLTKIPVPMESLPNNRFLIMKLSNILSNAIISLRSINEVGKIRFFSEELDVPDTIFKYFEIMMKDLIAKLIRSDIQPQQASSPSASNTSTRLRPNSCLLHLNNIRHVFYFILESANIQADKIIKNSIEDVLSVTIDSGNFKYSNVGIFIKYFEDEFTNFYDNTDFTTDINKKIVPVFRRNTSCFISYNPASNSFDDNSQFQLFSINGIRDLNTLIGPKGLAALDILSVKKLDEKFTQFDNLLRSDFSSSTKKKDVDPCRNIIQIIICIGCISKIREILHSIARETTHDIQFLNSQVNTKSDELFLKKVGTNSCFSYISSNPDAFIGAIPFLFKSHSWVELLYNQKYDFFGSNIDLIGGFVDCIVAALEKNKQFNVKSFSQSLLEQIHRSIIEATTNNKKVDNSQRALIADIALDHIVCSSVSMNHSVLSHFLSYNRISLSYRCLGGG